MNPPYSQGSKANKELYEINFIKHSRISREKVLLPVNENGTPNWQYMSDFVKKIELDNIEKILSNIYIYI